ncbi:MAG TPA: L-seryl-tRNA(Sec) selenium transferase [Gemmatimonadales bacterium]|nr:L-seryl-tRNA(Sec) selenium transferase [Gemmatimonadales bacterium]
MSDRRRELPSVGQILEQPSVSALLERAPRTLVVAAVRGAVAAARRGRAALPEDWAAEVRARLEAAAVPSLAPVINATGVVLHTNLGRAPLADAAVQAILAVAGGYSALEFDLHAGTRGSRTDHGRARLRELTGAADGFAVNNAAGALVLALNTFAAGSRVAISRGELIEIGGSFRIPEILERSGARLHEVGTTNRTHLADYAAAAEAGVGAIVVVHRSNFTQHGFVATPPVAEIAHLGARAGIPVIYDLGGGLAVDLSRFGLSGEPTIREAMETGAELVLFSGDKLLGGPQAGVIAGAAGHVARCRANPLARALRADKLTLSALDATLALYADPAIALREIPVLAMLTADPRELARRAAELAALVPAPLRAETVPGSSAVGGGAFPGAALSTTLVALDPGPLGPDGFALRLRLGSPPIVPRVAEGRVLLDPRTIRAPFPVVAEALAAAFDGG